MNLKDELGKLKFYFARGKKTYKAYLEHGSIYLYAKILKENNNAIFNVLTNIYSKSPECLQKDILELVYHLDVWLSNWDSLFLELQPKVSEKFVFQNAVTYPRFAEENILKFYEVILND